MILHGLTRPGRPGPTRRRGRRRAGPALPLALALGVLLAVAGCGATPTPSPAPPSPSMSPIPEASFTGGPASARLDLPAPTSWEGGWCERGPDDAWLALNIGLPNGAEYFGLVVGQSQYTPLATRGAAGGGTFAGDDATITWRTRGAARHLVPAGLAVEIARDLSIGTFSGRLADGTEVRGTFAC